MTWTDFKNDLNMSFNEFKWPKLILNNLNWFLMHLTDFYLCLSTSNDF